ncbi:MAG: cob(I)yrinic acid a,c-diamide adenosyltransferase [Actinomycetota bacterium]
MPRIYTKTGDDGSTGLLYGGRISKADPATEAYGAVDEAVAAMGVARALTENMAFHADLLRLQRELFVVGAELAANPDARERLVPGVSLVTEDMVLRLEQLIDSTVAEHPLPNEFVVPGATPLSAALDVARSVVRRAERRTVAFRDAGGAVSDELLRYLNRLSDLLFCVARWQAGHGEPPSREPPHHPPPSTGPAGHEPSAPTPPGTEP